MRKKNGEKIQKSLREQLNYDVSLTPREGKRRKVGASVPEAANLGGSPQVKVKCD